MTRSAAFFDLDRTLLAGASGEVLTDALRHAGVVGRSLPGQGLLYKVFNTFGETLPSMALARQAARLAKGKSRSAVRAAAAEVAPRLAEMVQPFAWATIEMHRDEGRMLVLATTTPVDLVEPFAELIGFDAVVATRYAVEDDGDTYTGGLDGVFTWANGKMSAVKQFADAHDIDLDESYAYSDSVYDSFLLSAVGRPVVVNPDPRMVVMAAARNWPIINFDVSPGVQKVPVLGIEWQRLAMSVTRPELVPYADIRLKNVDEIPADGPVILVANHRSYFDPMIISMVVSAAGRTARFLGKKEVFDAPVVGQFASAFGGIRVDRGTGSDEPLKRAATALDAGELVAIMPQGTIPRGPAFFDPVLKGRYGAARLAAMTGAPVIPVGLWGTEKVWPRSSRLPDVLNVTSPPKVTAKVGEAVELAGESNVDDTNRIMGAISDLLPKRARRPYEPSEEELALTYPPGYRGDPQAEVDRRPGTDTDSSSETG